MPSGVLTHSGVGVAVRVAVAVRVRVRVALRVAVRVAVSVAVRVSVAVADRVTVAVAVAVAIGVCVTVGVGDDVEVMVGVAGLHLPPVPAVKMDWTSVWVSARSKSSTSSMSPANEFGLERWRCPMRQPRWQCCQGAASGRRQYAEARVEIDRAAGR
jgi:hypothetical protein